MPQNLVFATKNKNKIKEIEAALSGDFILKSLNDIGCREGLAETGKTLQENAFQKAQFVAKNYHVNCFSDDTGLEVEALNGQPGVFSARYAGIANDSEKNIQKLLQELKGIQNRSAQFRTVICLILGNETHYFEGIVTGKILESPVGENGFGYDPIFVPDGYNISFAQMSLEQKNQISHRAIAFKKLIEFLTSHYS